MINTSAFDRVLEQAFIALVDDFAIEQVNQLEDPKWEWDRITKRKSGVIVDSPRDIVDIGTLRDALTIEYIDQTEAEISYPVDYAIDVHEGATRSDGSKMPARSWVTAAVDELDLVQVLADNLEELL